MDIARIRREIRTVKALVGVLSEMENQDQGLIVQMVEDALTDIETGDELTGLVALDYYIKRYCDVIDGPKDVEPIVRRVLRHLDEADAADASGPGE